MPEELGGHRDPRHGARQREQESDDESGNEPRCRRENAARAHRRPPPEHNDEPADGKRQREQPEVVADLGRVRAVRVPRPERVEPGAEEQVTSRGNDELERAEAVCEERGRIPVNSSGGVHARGVRSDPNQSAGADDSARRGADEQESASSLGRQGSSDRERDRGHDGHSAEVAGGQPARERRNGDEPEPGPRRSSHGGDQGENEQRQHLEVCQRRVLGTRKVPGEDHEGECGPRRDDSAATEIPREEIHRGARQDVAGERDQVVGSDGAEELRREIRRVVREEPLDVEAVSFVPAERRAAERVMRCAEQVVAALMLQGPEERNRSRRIRARGSDDRRPQVGDDGPHERADEQGHAEQDDHCLDRHTPNADARRRRNAP